MKIYTKGGDHGETGLFGGRRVPKDHLRIQSYGSLDELNAWIGKILTEEGIPSSEHGDLVRIQAELFQLGSELATPSGKSPGIPLIDSEHVLFLEKKIDEMQSQLPALKTFILPGGSSCSASIHLARTVTRRAERELVSLNQVEPLRSSVLQYVNRLSDYFFVLARYLNHLLQIPDQPWKGSSYSV